MLFILSKLENFFPRSYSFRDKWENLDHEKIVASVSKHTDWYFQVFFLQYGATFWKPNYNWPKKS